MESVLMTAKTTKSKEISVIRVNGHLDVVTAEELETTIHAQLKANCPNIIIDLSEVEYISSMGWGVFLSSIKEVRSHGGDLKLTEMQPNVFEVFKVLEFGLFLNCYDTLEEAALDFNSAAKPFEKTKNGHI